MAAMASKSKKVGFVGGMDIPLIRKFECGYVGGAKSAGATDVIQRIDPANGKAVVAGHLPRPLQGAATISLSGQIYVAGGATAGAAGSVARSEPVLPSNRTRLR